MLLPDKFSSISFFVAGNFVIFARLLLAKCAVTDYRWVPVNPSKLQFMQFNKRYMLDFQKTWNKPWFQLSMFGSTRPTCIWSDSGQWRNAQPWKNTSLAACDTESGFQCAAKGPRQAKGLATPKWRPVRDCFCISQNGPRSGTPPHIRILGVVTTIELKRCKNNRDANSRTRSRSMWPGLNKLCPRQTLFHLGMAKTGSGYPSSCHHMRLNVNTSVAQEHW